MYLQGCGLWHVDPLLHACYGDRPALQQHTEGFARADASPCQCLLLWLKQLACERTPDTACKTRHKKHASITLGQHLYCWAGLP